jgi:hypothetical protein
VTSRDDVEFLAEDGEPLHAGEDIVEFGRPRVSRRITALTCLTVAAVIVAVLAVRRHPSRPSAQPAAPSTVAAVAPAAGPPTSRIGEPVKLGAGVGDPVPLRPLRVFDTLLSGDTLYALQSGNLTATVRSHLRQVGLDGLEFTDNASARLVIDAPRNRLWVVVENLPDATIIEFDASTLARLRTVTWATPIAQAAALDGSLYLATRSGLAVLAPAAAEPALVPGPHGAFAAVAADPTRARLIVLDFGFPARVYVLRRGGRLTEMADGVPLGNGSVAVTADGTIWAGGFGHDGDAVLTLLDPTTLHPTHQSPLANELGPGAVVVAAGHRDVWVRNGAGGRILYCMDGRSGDKSQQWADAPGGVTSQNGVAYVGSGTSVRPLIMGVCVG